MIIEKYSNLTIIQMIVNNKEYIFIYYSTQNIEHMLIYISIILALISLTDLYHLQTMTSENVKIIVYDDLLLYDSVLL